MTELETIAHAKNYLDAMAKGNSPLTGEPVPETDLINNVRISRCLFFVSDILRQVLEQGGVKPPRNAEKEPFHLDHKQLKNFSFSDSAIPVSEIANRINALIDETVTKKFKYSSITEFLLSCGLLSMVDLPSGNAVRRPTEDGNKLGIFTEEREGQYGTYLVTLYNPEAQHFIIDNFDAILEINNKPRQKSEKASSRGRVWFADEDEKLTELFHHGMSVSDLAAYFKRTEAGIRARLVRLNLIENRQDAV